MTIDTTAIKERLKARREILTQISPWPWRRTWLPGGRYKFIIDSGHNTRFIGRNDAIGQEKEVITLGSRRRAVNEANANFIATAPETEAQLLKDVEALVEVVEKLEYELGKYIVTEAEQNKIMREALEYIASVLFDGRCKAGFPKSVTMNDLRGKAQEALKKVNDDNT